MGRIPQNIKTRINLNKHLEKSKCFFHAQKGVKDVYMGLGINRFRVVGIFVFNAIYHSVCKISNQRN